MNDAREGDSAQGRADPGAPVARGAGGARDWDAFRIRQATRRDANAVGEFLAAMLQDMASYSELCLDETNEVGTHRLERFRGSLEKDDHVHVVVPVDDCGDELVGIMEASFISPPAILLPQVSVYIHSFYVQSRWRGQDMGRSLLEEALERGKGMRGGRAECVSEQPCSPGL